MFAEAFLKMFPAPHYLVMSAVGLDISDRSVKFVELKERGRKISLVNFGAKEIPLGAISAGNIEDKKLLKEVFTELRKENHFSGAIVSLPEEKAFVFSLTLKGISRSDLRESIELQIESHVPFPASQVVFDYDIVSRDEETIQVVVSVLPKIIVESYWEVLFEADITPLVFEIEAQAVARSLIPRRSQETFLIVDFGQTRTGFTLVDAGIVKYSSTVPIGGSQINRAISERFKIKEEAARKMKEESGLLRKKNDDLFAAIMPSTSALRDEIEKYRLYWDRHKDESGGERRPVEKIILTGGDSNIPGLSDYLASGFDVPFVLGNPWINLFSFDEVIPEIPKSESLRYSTAIGLALRKTALFALD